MASPMSTRAGFAALVLLAAAPLAPADEVRLTATEIGDLLRGRTAIGTWQGTPYRQYFYADGTTIFAPKGQRSTRGEWRIDPARDVYESWWEGPGWEAWSVIRREGSLYWTGSGIEPEPFVMVDGQDLVWPE